MRHAVRTLQRHGMSCQGPLHGLVQQLQGMSGDHQAQHNLCRMLKFKAFDSCDRNQTANATVQAALSSTVWHVPCAVCKAAIMARDFCDQAKKVVHKPCGSQGGHRHWHSSMAGLGASTA